MTTINGISVDGWTATELEPSIGLNMYHTTNNTHLSLVLALDDMDVTWLGWGISEMGHMKGSDIVSLEFSKSMDVTSVHIEDRYVPFEPITVDEDGVRTYGNLYPHIDKKSDWSLESVNGKAGCVIPDSDGGDATRAVLLSRKLDTNDKHDRAISTDEVPLVWAWGTNTGGVKYHGANYGTKTQFRFIGDGPSDPGLVLAAPTSYDSMTEFTISDYAIPPTDTTYKRFEWNMTLGDSKVHIVAVELVNRHPNLHHLVLYQRDGSAPVFLFTDDSIQTFLKCGFPVGGSEAGAWDGKSDVEIHYDNPTDATDLVDSQTTLKVYYKTNDLMEHDCGIIILGDINLQMDEIVDAVQSEPVPYDLGPLPKNTEFVHRQSTCPKECTTALPEPITVFGGSLHMHYYGHKIILDHYDEDGELITNRARSDFWDNGHQYMDPEISFTLKPGESLQTHCVFNTKIHDKDVMFDQNTSQEMCQTFLLYYPAKAMTGGDRPLDLCGMYVHHDDSSSTNMLFSLCGTETTSDAGEHHQIGRNGSLDDPVGFGDTVSGDQEEGSVGECTWSGSVRPGPLVSIALFSTAMIAAML